MCQITMLPTRLVYITNFISPHLQVSSTSQKYQPQTRIQIKKTKQKNTQKKKIKIKTKKNSEKT